MTKNKISFGDKLVESFRYIFDPKTVKNIEQPLDNEESKKIVQKSTEFGSISDQDVMDVDVISGSNFQSLFQVNKTSEIDKTINDYIKTYRRVSQIAYVNQAIDEIVNEAIFKDDLPKDQVYLEFNDRVEGISAQLREKIQDEFSYLMDLLDFDDKGDEYFRQWYVDGRLLMQIILDKQNTKKGIIGVKTMSPLYLKRHQDKKDNKKYYVHDNEDLKIQTNKGPKDAVGLIPDELVVFVPSGLYATNSPSDKVEKRLPVSYLHTALKNINRLDTLEDHFLIYRIVRAPERRVFYIDAGNLPPKKAEEYLKKVMNAYKQKKVFNDTDGTMMSRNQHPSILEDFFLLRRNGKGTEIDTVGSVGGLGEIDDLLYFRREAAKAMHVPFSRLNNEDRQGTGVGPVTGNEITREELTFSKFISRTQNKFAILFHELLKRQLIYKNIIKESDWKEIKRKLKFVFKTDTQFAMAKRLQSIEMKLGVIQSMDDYIGKYYTRKDVYTKVMGMTSEEIKEHEKRIEEEKALYKDDEETSGF